MISPPEPDSGKERGPGVGGAVGGASLGTMIALLANNLPEDKWYKSWLVILAPGIAVIAGVIWTRIDSFFLERRIRKVLKEAERTLQAEIDNPNTPERRRAELRRELIDLRMLKVRSDIDRVKGLITRRRNE